MDHPEERPAARDGGWESRWTRWARWPYKLLAGLLFLISLVPYWVDPDTGWGAGLRIAALFPAVASLVLTLGPTMHRGFSATRSEAKHDPLGVRRPTTDERVAALDHRKARWAYLAAWTTLMSAVTVWLIYLAATRHESGYIGLAVLTLVPALLMAGVTWRFRSVLKGSR